MILSIQCEGRIEMIGDSGEVDLNMTGMTFVGPIGDEIWNPDPERIVNELMTAGPLYWEAGSGDAALRWRVGGKVTSEVILMVRVPHGVFVQFVDPTTGHEYVVTNAVDSDEIVIQHAGAPWKLPRRYFVSRELACEAIRFFIAQGKRSDKVNWTAF